MFAPGLLLTVFGSFVINSAVDACGMGMTRQGLKKVVIGDLSTGSDDAPSVATCPSGSIVSECFCSDSPNCDGVFVDGSQCTANNKYGNSAGIQAVAVCLTAPSSDYEVVVSGDQYEDNPEATCPCDFRVESCYLNNPWTQNGCREPSVTSDGKTCTSKAACTAGRGCRAFAICRRLQ